MRQIDIDAASKWLEGLGALCAGNVTAEVARAKVQAYAPMLAMRYPAGTLDLHALEFVAADSRIRFWPSYGLLVEVIESWRALYRPQRLRPAPPTPPPPTPEVTISPEEKERIRIGLLNLASELRSKFAENAPPVVVADVSLKGDALTAMRSQNPPLRRQ